MTNYIIAIKTGIYLFPLIAFFFTIFFVIFQYHKYGSINILRVLIIYSFILYLLIIYFLVILPLPKYSSVQTNIKDMVRLIPFSFISDIIRETSFRINDLSTYLKALTEPCFYVVFFNILMTMPFGIYMHYYFKCSLKKTIVISFLLSLFFELTQLTGLYFIYKGPYRLFDVDDLILNTLGGALGYLTFNLLEKYLPSREEIDTKSKINGQKVSGLRRITVFLLDLVIYLFIKLLLNFTLEIPAFITFINYYILIPYLLKGKTLGSKFLNVRLEFSNYTFLRLSLRNIFLYCYYIFTPINLIILVTKFNEYLNLTAFEKIWFYFISFLIIGLFYLINCLIIIRKRQIYYDSFFKVTYISTINND